MKFHRTRRTLAETKCEIEMTPTLDIIFQMLIFFILTFRPIADEGQFGVNLSMMPAGSAAMPSMVPGMGDPDSASVQFVPPLRVRLLSTPDGRLAANGIALGDRGISSIEYLRFELQSTVGDSPDDFEVIIEADSRLHYQYVVQAVNAVSHAGVKKINFGSPLNFSR